MGALARLHVGTAFAMAGDTTRATAAYLDLLAPWEDAPTPASRFSSKLKQRTPN